jgi:hypothetical protein
MFISTAARQSGDKLALRAVPLILAMMGATAASAQETARGRTNPREGAAFPRLPDAVSKPPAWLGTEAPFDVAQFFAAPPRDRNAAPLYLDALFEFGDGVAECYPAGPQRERRRRAATDRSKRYTDLMQPIFNVANADVPPAVADEVIRLYDEGMRKLKEAQRRDQCVFETGLSVYALLPHVQAARQVARIVAIRVHQSVQRGDLEGAIRDVEIVLRLARDLQRRGVTITQLVASSLNQVVGFSMVSAILSSPKLKAKDCDALLRVLLTHDQKSTDGYAEGLRADCVTARATLRDLVLHQREIAARFKQKPGESVIKAALKDLNGGRDLGDAVPDDIDARVARTTPSDLTRSEREIDRYYRTALALDGVPAAEVLRKLPAVKRIESPGPLSVLTGMLAPPEVLESIVRATSRARTTVRASECLVAMRRWQLTHRDLPRSLLIAAKDAGLKSVPIDPYDGKPMRLVSVNGEPVIYSVGRDGKDDGGEKDSKNDAQAGDLLYRLPAIEDPHRIRPASVRGKPASVLAFHTAR